VICTLLLQADAISLFVERGWIGEHQRRDRTALTNALAHVLNAALGFTDPASGEGART
jgi:hypothetical protein